MNVLVRPDQKDSQGNWIKYLPKENGSQPRTYSYVIWNSMRLRCKDGGYYKKLHPSYQHCILSEQFKCFQLFAEWIRLQVGYGLDGYQLDKDFLKKDVSIYSPETCVLIPKQLNLFLLDRSLDRGKYAQGVSLKGKNGRFVSYVSDLGVNKYLGLFDTEEEAFLAYKKEKESIARLWYERVTNGTYVVDERVAEKLKTWTINS